MKNKKLTIVFSFLLVIVMTLSLCLVACDNDPQGDGGGTQEVNGKRNPVPTNSNYSTLNVVSYQGGVGNQWLYDAATRFQEKYANTSFEDGKEGVWVQIFPEGGNVSTLIDSSSYHVAFDERASAVYNMANTGKILPITDVVTTKDADGKSIEDRLSPHILDGLKGADGEYYALPNYEIYPGLTYNKKCFEEERWYLAKDAANGTRVECKFGTAFFVKDENSEKSLGPDGLTGVIDGVDYSADDGLPATVQELLILCYKIKRDGFVPFTLSGTYNRYISYLIQGLWASLAGYDEMQTVYSFNGDVKIVDGYSDENLFEGISYIKKPNVKTVTINDDNGYLVYNSVARYYAISLVGIAYNEGWFGSEATGSTNNHEAMGYFINGGLPSQTSRAFLIEGSYWYNDLSIYSPKIIDGYLQLTQEKDLEVAFCSLPVAFYNEDLDGVTDRRPTLSDGALTYAYVTAKCKNDQKMLELAKTFLQFCYSEEENVKFNLSTGLPRPFNYQLSESERAQLPYYQQTVYDLRVKALGKNGTDDKIVYSSSPNPIFKNNFHSFKLHFSCSLFMVDGTTSYYEYIRKSQDKNSAVKMLFEYTCLKESKWNY